MKKVHILWALLALSVLANAFFIGGSLYARGSAEGRFGHAGRPPAMGPGALGLSDEQARAFQNMAGQLRAHGEAYREDLRPVMVAFREQLAGSDPDPEVLAGYLREITDRRHRMQLGVIGDLQTLMAELEPGQRRLFIQFARRTPIFRMLGIGFDGRRSPGGRPGFRNFRERGSR